MTNAKMNLCCIQHDPLIYEAIRDAFQGNRAYQFKLIAHNCDALNSREQELRDSIEVAVIDLPDDEVDIDKAMTSMRDILPNAWMVLLIQTLTPAKIARTFKSGAAGCLDRRHDIAFLPIYCDLVRHGVPVYPAMLAEIIKHYHGWFEELVYPPPVYDLSSREREVLEYVASGYSNKEVARHLGITEATVKVHLRSILQKLRAQNRTQAAIRAVQHGLIDKHG
jgi:two-component system nitrate/nitrite response regulator NarL